LKSEQVSKYKIIQISKKKTGKTEKGKKNREEAPCGLAQHERHLGGGN
jgi:hypothetical protein